jgi:hypothetical protein
MTRDSKNNYKYLYISRSTIDLEYNRPFIENTNCLIMTLYSKKLAGHIKNTTVEEFDRRTQSLFSIYLFASRFRRLRTRLHSLSGFVAKYALQNILTRLRTKVIKIVLFDHTNNEIYKIIANELKQKDLCVVAIPHGEHIFENITLDTKEISISKATDLSLFDKVLVTSQEQKQIIKGSVSVVPSLRYHPFWVANLYLNNKRFDDSPKLRILVLHSKSIGGVSLSQMRRTLRFLKGKEDINLRIRAHPRGGKKELKKIGINDAELISCCPLEDDIAWADALIHFQSSGFIDAAILQKKVIFCQFASANTIAKTYEKEMVIAKNFDEFISAVNALKKSSNNCERLQNVSSTESFRTSLKIWTQYIDTRGGLA